MDRRYEREALRRSYAMLSLHPPALDRGTASSIVAMTLALDSLNRPFIEPRSRRTARPEPLRFPPASRHPMPKTWTAWHAENTAGVSESTPRQVVDETKREEPAEKNPRWVTPWVTTPDCRWSAG
jgi:hypothetical protein